MAYQHTGISKVNQMKIAISQRIIFHNGRAYDSLDHSWYKFLQGHQLIPIANVLPAHTEDVDALIITGGDDHAIRNQIETHWATWMISQDRPVIGVCHGCQLLTQILGGSVTPVDDHQDCYHEVVYNDQPHLVNSYHKLRIEQPPPLATALAWDPDDWVEAWIQGRTAAVMWHPERMVEPWMPQEIQQLLDR